MTEIKVWGMDSWSGRELLNTLEFKTLEGAEDYVSQFNSKNDLSQTPEYYEYAELS